MIRDCRVRYGIPGGPDRGTGPRPHGPWQRERSRHHIQLDALAVAVGVWVGVGVTVGGCGSV